MSTLVLPKHPSINVIGSSVFVEHDTRITEASRTAGEALQRAKEAGKLAEGKLLYETVLTDEKVKFGFDTSDLSPEAREAAETAIAIARDRLSGNNAQTVMVKVRDGAHRHVMTATAALTIERVDALDR